MSSLKTCNACGRKYLQGRKALVLGVMRSVCVACSERAIRVCVAVSNVKCTSETRRHGRQTECNGTASVCTECVDEKVREALEAPLRGPIAMLEAMISGLVLTEKAFEPDFVAGKVEGLQSALTLLRSSVTR